MFKKPRRAPRKVGRDEGEDKQSSTTGLARPSNDPDDEPAVVVKRPQAQSKLAKAKKAHVASVRASLDYEQDTEAQDEPEPANQDDPFAALERKKSAAQKNRASLASSRLPFRSPESAERPMYNADYLTSLRNEQQTAPRPIDPSNDLEMDLDPEPEPEPAPADQEPSIIDEPMAEPGVNVIRMTDSTKTAIPTDTEIREKKERRRRLALQAKADDYISLDDNDARASSDSDDDPRKRSLIIPAEELAEKSKYGESRLGGAPLDDDDFGEGFDSFVEDAGRVALGRKGMREQKASRRADMDAQIRRAERGASASDGSGASDDDDPDERARTRAYEAAQTRRGTYGERHTATNHRERERARGGEERWRRLLAREYKPRADVGNLEAAVARFKARAAGVRAGREQAERRLEQIRAERAENAKEQVRVQELVREAGEKLERLMRGGNDGGDGGKGGQQGVASSGPDAASAELQRDDEDEDDEDASESSDEDDDEDEEMTAAPGLGSSAAAASAASNFMTDRPTSFAGMGRPPSPDW